MHPPSYLEDLAIGEGANWGLRLQSDEFNVTLAARTAWHGSSIRWRVNFDSLEWSASDCDDGQFWLSETSRVYLQICIKAESDKTDWICTESEQVCVYLKLPGEWHSHILVMISATVLFAFFIR